MWVCFFFVPHAPVLRVGVYTEAPGFTIPWNGASPSFDVALISLKTYSPLNASAASTCAALIAGSADATTAAINMTLPDTISATTPGACTSAVYFQIPRTNANPNNPPAVTPTPAITNPSNKTFANIRFGCAPSASRTPNSLILPLTENASTPATPTTE